MENLSTKVNDISRKVEKLILLQSELKKENAELRQLNSQLTRDAEEHRSKVIELENKNRVVKLAKSLNEASAGKNNDARQKVNELIREVDKCIALLNR